MSRKRQNPNKRVRRVDVINNYADNTCLLMAMNGKTNKAIMKETGLTPGMISYRLHHWLKGQRMAFRNGTSAYAKKADQLLRPLSEEELVAYLNKHT